MTTTNDDLFIDVLAHIESDPASWNQRIYTSDCGTAACFAGWAVALSECRCLNELGVHVAIIDGHEYTIGAAAGYLLGLVSEPDDDTYVDGGMSTGFADGLFCEFNSLDDLYRISAKHMNVEPEVLRDKVQDRIHA